MPRTLAVGRTLATRRPASLSGLFFSNAQVGFMAVTLSNIAALQGLTTLTVECWAFLNFSSNNTTRLMEWFASTHGWEFLYFGKGIRVQLGNSTTTAILQSTGTLSPTAWHHIAFTWDAATLRLFIDGTSTGTPQTLTGGNTGNPAVAPLIGNQSGGGQPWNGVISEFRISNVARYVSNFAVPTQPFAPDSNTVGLYHMWDGPGQPVMDSSSQANHGALLGSGATMPQSAPGYFTGGPSSRQLVGGNLVSNGNFEFAPSTNVAQTSGVGQWIDGTSTGAPTTGSATNAMFGWGMLSDAGGAHSSNMFDNSTSHSGNYSMKQSILAAGAYTQSVAIVPLTTAVMTTTYGIPCLPSTSYTMTAWMKTTLNSGTATTGARFALTERTASGTQVNLNASSPTVITTTGWTQYTITITTASTTRFLTPRLDIISDGTATLIMDAFFDDIVLVPTVNNTRSLAV